MASAALPSRCGGQSGAACICIHTSHSGASQLSEGGVAAATDCAPNKKTRPRGVRHSSTPHLGGLAAEEQQEAREAEEEPGGEELRRRLEEGGEPLAEQPEGGLDGLDELLAVGLRLLRGGAEVDVLVLALLADARLGLARGMTQWMTQWMTHWIRTAATACSTVAR